MRREALGRLEVIADTALSVSTPVQRAVPTFLERLEELQAPLKRRLESNLRILRAKVLPDSPASLLEPEAGWSVVLRVPATVSEEQRAVHLLEDLHVLVHPGHLFDFPRGAHLVLSLLPPPEVFEEGVDRVFRDLIT
jgi:hypothetical protein